MKTILRRPISPSIKIGLTGDFVPGLSPYKPINIKPDLERLMDSCDFIAANLESPLTDEFSWKPKGYGGRLRSDPASVMELNKLNIKLANLANNHILDCGLKGLEDTIIVLEKNGIAWFGAGKDLKQTSKPYFMEISKIRIAFLAYTYETHDVSPMAQEDNGGPNPFEFEKVKKEITELKKRGFIVCVSYHGGWQLFRVPTKIRRDVMREIAGCGADLVVGHHAHVFQGAEYIDANLIVYGLGNFYFYMPDRNKIVYKGTDIGLFMIVEMDQKGPVSYYPHFVHANHNDSSLHLIRGKKEIELNKMFYDLSNITSSDKQHKIEWRYDCCRKALGLNSSHNTFYGLVFSFSRLYKRIIKSKFLRFISSTKLSKSKDTLKNKRVEYIALRKVSPEYTNPLKDIIVAIILCMPRAILNPRHVTKWYRVYNIED
jgi:poly-gamma-glutamate synthesis protein (capsule biosynthesis protein)